MTKGSTLTDELVVPWQGIRSRSLKQWQQLPCALRLPSQLRCSGAIIYLRIGESAQASVTDCFMSFLRAWLPHNWFGVKYIYYGPGSPRSLENTKCFMSYRKWHLKDYILKLPLLSWQNVNYPIRKKPVRRYQSKIYITDLFWNLEEKILLIHWF